MHRITVGGWREDRTAPMQVVSGPVDRERLHFEAPAAGRLDEEMRRFVEWFNGDTATEPVLKAALAHLSFVTIHPFDDGNGRIARAIADRLLEGFEGKLTTSKWALLTKSSTDTALRDIQQLVERGVLVRNEAGGRSTSYSLAGL
jgi:Fic family protein